MTNLTHRIPSMRYVALLRGINVGGTNKLSMADLKTAFEDAGMTEVRTYVNSGNVIFSADVADRARLVQELLDRKDATRSRLTKMVGTPLYSRVTVRNCNTTRKLLDLLRG